MIPGRSVVEDPYIENPSCRKSSNKYCLEIPYKVSIQNTTLSTISSDYLTDETDVLTCDSIVQDQNIFVNAAGTPLPHKEHREWMLDDKNTEECFFTDDIKDVQYNVPVPKQDRQRTPISILTTHTVELVKTKQVYRVLFDTESTRTLTHKSCIPTAARPKKLQKDAGISAMNGTDKASEVVTLQKI